MQVYLELTLSNIDSKSRFYLQVYYLFKVSQAYYLQSQLLQLQQHLPQHLPLQVHLPLQLQPQQLQLQQPFLLQQIDQVLVLLRTIMCIMVMT